MTTVSFNPTSVTVQAGGSPVQVQCTIEGVPADVTLAQVIDTVVGVVTVQATLGITVDNPAPTQSATAAGPYSLSFATPVQDAQDPTKWTSTITIDA